MFSGDASELENLRQQVLAKRGGATKALVGGYSTQAQKKRGGADELTSLVAKRRADAIKISTLALRDRLVKELDQVMTDQFRAHPELKGEAFVGFVMGETPTVEVVNIDDAAKRVTDVPYEEAKEILSAKPVGYFQPNDFSVETPDSEPYQSFKRGLTDYLRKNAKVIQYLQANPEQIASREELIRPV